LIVVDGSEVEEKQRNAFLSIIEEGTELHPMSDAWKQWVK